MTWSDDYLRFAVLFVDDEEMARKYFSRSLTSELEVLTAASVADARVLLAEHAERIAVLVTDQRMPGGNGVELLRYAREHHPQIIRLLTTAYSDLDEAIEAVNRGEIFRYVTKPWDVDQLQVEVGQALELFWLRRERELLLAEKLAARSRLLQLNRARDLLNMAAGMAHLRLAVPAMASFLGTAAAYREDWGLNSADDQDHEIERSLALAGRVLATTRGGEGLDATVDLAAAAGDLAGSSIRVQGPVTVSGDRLLLTRLLHLLVGQGELSLAATAEGGAELRLIPPRPWPALANFYAGTDAVAQAGDGLTDLLAAHLICYHHGGSAALDVAADGGRCLRLRLPGDPASAVAPAASPYWLEDLLAGFEPGD